MVLFGAGMPEMMLTGRGGRRLQSLVLVLLRYLLFVLAALLSMPGNAAAESPVVALDYSAPAICPNAAEFQREIQRLLPGLVVVSRAGAARVFEVSIDPSGVFGELRVIGEQGGGSRQTRGADCAEVARLLAFAAALVLDPSLQIAEEPPVEVSGGSGEPGPESANPPQPLPTPAAPPMASRRDRGVHQAARRRGAALKQRLGAMGFAGSATSPTPTYGVGALYDIAARFGSIEPELRLGGSYSQSADASRGGATVTFVNVLGLLEACPDTLHAGSLDLLPCLRVDAGGRSTTGRGIPNAKNRLRPWLSFDTLLHVRWHLASSVLLELGGGAVFPAWHDRVFFEPDITVHQVPNVGWLGEIAVHVEFADQNRN